MEKIDRQILRLLSEDGRMSYTDLGKATGLSTSAVHQRVKRLEERGLITGYGASVDHAKAGRPLTAFISITPFDPASPDDYPERLSRGLVLIKWWLLAIPHLIVVALLAGATWTWGSGTGDFGTSYERGRGLSLLGLLVFIAAMALLFTGRYLRPLFDLILGINRWIYRVLAYTALMRDEYPPFRLDQGPRETAAPATGPPFQPVRPQ